MKTNTGLRALAVMLLLGLLTVSAVSAPAPRPVVVAVIANQSVPVDGLSFSELRRVFLGDRQFWTSDLRVVLLVPGWRAAEREILLERIYKKNETQYRSYWIAKVFTTDVASPPKSVASTQAASRLVREIEGAVTLVDAASIPPGVKVLKIDGKRPGDTGYPLQ